MLMRSNKLNILLVCLLVIVVLSLIPTDTWAQCPMCRMTAETNLKHGGSAGKGLNKGILYLLSLPYLIVGGIGYVWWKNRKKIDN